MLECPSFALFLSGEVLVKGFPMQLAPGHKGIIFSLSHEEYLLPSVYSQHLVSEGIPGLYIIFVPQAESNTKDFVV